MDELEKILNNLEAEERNLLATKTIIVLGAGASFGSSLVNKHLRPPLINEFLKVANELGILSKEDFKPLWDYLENQSGIPFSRILDMESERFLNIEQVYSLIAELDGEGKMEKTIERFLYEVLSETTKVYKNKTCKFHDMILKKLRPDAIISFNYDLIIDRSLSFLYPNWENYQISEYNLVYNGEKFIETEEYLSGKDFGNIDAKEFPALFKLHGSLNKYYDLIEWEQTRARVRWIERRTDYIVPLKYAFDTPRLYQKRTLREYAPSTLQTTPWLYDDKTTEIKLDLTAPTLNKKRNDWENVIDELKQAKKIVFFGYSMSDIDLWALRMFRLAYQKHQHKNELIVEVVNYNEEVIQKVRSIYYDSRVENPAQTLREYC